MKMHDSLPKQKNGSGLAQIQNQAGNIQGKGYKAQTTYPLPQVQLKKVNSTGLPGTLKEGIESLSGYSLDDVKVYYNSSKPTRLNAHAFAQGTNIHVAPGQEKHLPHEAWHVVQQKQGRVVPTASIKEGVKINNDPGLEKEADFMGLSAHQFKTKDNAAQTNERLLAQSATKNKNIIQRVKIASKSEHLKKGHSKLSAMRRAARTLRIERKRLGKWTTRNLLTATIKHGGFAFTFHLQSAGLGGKHPRYNKKSAAHTEQQFRALVLGKNNVLKAYLNSLLSANNKAKLLPADDLNVRNIFSTNQACDKNASMPHGCESIDTADMSMGSNGRFFFAEDYHTGGAKGTRSHFQIKNEYEKEAKQRGETRLRRSNSFDLLINSDKLRNMNVEDLKVSDFDKMVTIDPETDNELKI